MPVGMHEQPWLFEIRHSRRCDWHGERLAIVDPERETDLGSGPLNEASYSAPPSVARRSHSVGGAADASCGAEMNELRVELSESDQVWVSNDATGARLEFTIITDKAGRRHLDGPHGAVDMMIDGDNSLMRACALAQSEALHAGRVDY